LLFTLKAISAAVFSGDGFRHFEEGFRGVGEAGGFAIDQSQFAVQAQFADGDANQFAAGQFVFDADLGEQGYAVAHGDEAFDGLQSGEFDIHVQGGFMAFESLNHFFAIR